MVRLGAPEAVTGGRRGPGTAYQDPAGALRRLLGGDDGWVLVRPDTHVAWARPRRDGRGLGRAVARALGDPPPPPAGERPAPAER